jgi:membrane fusion protein (multidrug efflux system)
MRLKGALAWTLVVAAIVAGALAQRVLSSRSDAPGPPASSAPPSLAVEVVTLAPSTLVERMATTGTVRANEEVDVVCEITGKVAQIAFREGTRVRAGDLLLKIDDTQLVAERERAAYRLALAERSEARQRRLLDEGLVSQEGYDFALNELNVLRAELALAEGRLAKTEIRAPFGGVIGLRDVSLGAYLTPQTRIATLQDVNPVKIDFSVPERYAGQLSVGQEIRFRTRGSERNHPGRIVAIEPRVDLETRSLTLRALSANPEGTLVPGAFADVEIAVRSLDDALTVPSRAVIPELGGKKVFVVENGQAQPRAVETGLRTQDDVEIVSGLAAGERVIVTGIQRLRPGLAVSIEAGS